MKLSPPPRARIPLTPPPSLPPALPRAYTGAGSPRSCSLPRSSPRPRPRATRSWSPAASSASSRSSSSLCIMLGAWLRACSTSGTPTCSSKIERPRPRRAARSSAPTTRALARSSLSPLGARREVPERGIPPPLARAPYPKTKPQRSFWLALCAVTERALCAAAAWANGGGGSRCHFPTLPQWSLDAVFEHARALALLEACGCVAAPVALLARLLGWGSSRRARLGVRARARRGPARDLLDDRLGPDLGWGCVYGLVSGAALVAALQGRQLRLGSRGTVSLSVVAALGAFWTTRETRERALRREPMARALEEIREKIRENSPRPAFALLSGTTTCSTPRTRCAPQAGRAGCRSPTASTLSYTVSRSRRTRGDTDRVGASSVRARRARARARPRVGEKAESPSRSRPLAAARSRALALSLPRCRPAPTHQVRGRSARARAAAVSARLRPHRARARSSRATRPCRRRCPSRRRGQLAAGGQFELVSTIVTFSAADLYRALGGLTRRKLRVLDGDNDGAWHLQDQPAWRTCLWWFRSPSRARACRRARAAAARARARSSSGMKLSPLLRRGARAKRADLRARGIVAATAHVGYFGLGAAAARGTAVRAAVRGVTGGMVGPRGRASRLRSAPRARRARRTRPRARAAAGGAARRARRGAAGGRVRGVRGGARGRLRSGARDAADPSAATRRRRRAQARGGGRAERQGAQAARRPSASGAGRRSAPRRGRASARSASMQGRRARARERGARARPGRGRAPRRAAPRGERPRRTRREGGGEAAGAGGGRAAARLARAHSRAVLPLSGPESWARVLIP